jgi:TonB family protein
MSGNRTALHSNWLRKNLHCLLKTAAIALAVVLALPAVAADQRVVKSRVSPVYPEIARRLRISGVVKVETIVDPEGKVSSVKTLSGNMMLSPAAEDAVRKWRFAPAPAESTVDVDINFGSPE